MQNSREGAYDLEHCLLCLHQSRIQCRSQACLLCRAWECSPDEQVDTVFVLYISAEQIQDIVLSVSKCASFAVPASSRNHISVRLSACRALMMKQIDVAGLELRVHVLHLCLSDSSVSEARVVQK